MSSTDVSHWGCCQQSFAVVLYVDRDYTLQKEIKSGMGLVTALTANGLCLFLVVRDSSFCHAPSLFSSARWMKPWLGKENRNIMSQSTSKEKKGLVSVSASGSRVPV